MSDSETRFDVNGMKCDGCVAKATAAIRSVVCVTDVEVDLSGKSAVVKGDAGPGPVIQALKRVGYPVAVNRR